jgi:hypothetical protein
LICLDFDGYQKKKDLAEDKAKFEKNKFVFAVFVSPSGNGLKVLVQIPQDSDNHKKYFNALNKHFASPYFDTTSKIYQGCVTKVMIINCMLIKKVRYGKN